MHNLITNKSFSKTMECLPVICIKHLIEEYLATKKNKISFNDCYLLGRFSNQLTKTIQTATNIILST